MFYYICCHNALSSKVQCQELESDDYIAILFVCIFLVNFLAVMFSPLLIPAKFYRNKFQKTSYEHKLKEPLTLSILKTYNKPKGENVLPISHFEEMKEFRKTVEDMHIDIRYEVTLSKIDVVTEIDRLLPSNRVPVGLLESLYSALIKCEIRKKSSIKYCCKSNFLGAFTPFNNTLSWYNILRKIIQILIFLVVVQIWIFRILFFFEFEITERHEREKAAAARNLSLSYAGNLTWYLTPLHLVFLVCYSIFLIDVVIFGILTKHVKRTLKHVLRKCFRDMREIKRTTAIGWSVQILIHPFRHFGFFGLLFAWLYYIPAIPIVTITLAFYCLPTVNILVRLVIYFVAYLFPYGRNCLTVRCCIRMKQLWNYIHRVFRMDLITSQESIDKPGRISMKNRFLQLFVILACLLTISSCVLLAMECIVFLVEIVMYTLIGIIINASQVLIHSSLYHWLFL